MAQHPFILLLSAGTLAGFIDSIAGGGGLITLPTLALFLGTGIQTISTNKIPGLVAAAVALAVFRRHGHLDWGRSLVFSGWVWAGSFLGSLVSPHLPVWVFTWLLFLTCPLILWLVWRRDLWVESARDPLPGAAGWRVLLQPPIVGAGLACGFYDGAWGPGGGTFMFLALLVVARQPLLTAIAATKLANAGSALVALVSYAARGEVQWKLGAIMAVGIAAGAAFGASHATRRAARLVRPLLVVVVGLLLIRLLIH